MTAEPDSIINLPYWETGTRRIRFLYLVGHSSFQLTDPCTSETRAIPLFLGADLFSNTDIRTENHPRYHAKYAKRGLAAKLNFSTGFRFQGLRVPCSSNGLWFYCVHGLFRVAFELYKKQEQLSILQSFQDLWKSRINDEPLNPGYTIDIQLDHQPPNQSDQEPLISSNIPGPSGLSSTCQESPPHVTVSSLETFSSADHDYCSTADQPDSGQSTLLVEKLSTLANKVKSMSMDQKQQEAILKLVDGLDRWIDGPLDEEQLAEAVMVLLQSHDQAYSVYSSPLLQTLASWLGDQFHKANGSVSDQVEGFKMRHIEHIKDLPPAQDLATELFPEAMRNLLIHWMGLSEEEATWKRLSEFPIVLLILEFANHNLITGVAHVLYSSLICR